MKNYLLTAFILILWNDISAQSQGQVFQYNTSAKVNAWGNEKTLAWCGGANNPQFALADLNKDSKTDLVIHEPFVGLKTFLNEGTPGNPKYVYAPTYEHNFPQITGYLKLIDYNGDHIADLFQRGGAGFMVYKGYYNSKNELCFTYFKDLYYFSFSGWINAYCEPADIPAIVDVDKDGDLDFLSYYIGGGRISYYRNCAVEDGLSKDSIRLCLKDNCWGKTYQGMDRAQTLHSSCSQFGTTCKGCEKTTHTGNALCILDYDGDGDYDYLDGSVSYPETQLVLNGKKDYGFAQDSMLWQDSTWNSNGHMLSMPTWPAPFWLDIDQDDDSDLLFSPNAGGSENYKCIAYYKNTGTDQNPVFTYQSDSFLVSDMIDVGTGAYPFFYDYNKDGKADLFIGSDGFYQSNGTLKSMVSYYENTSSGSNISFTLQTMDFMQLSSYVFKGASIAIGDLDNDGKDDLVLGHTDGKLSYFKNTATSASVQPVWTLNQIILKDNANVDIVAGSYAAPVIYDIDKDGKKDLVIGNNTGFLTYYNNVGSVGNASLKYMTNKLGNAKSDPNSPYIYTMSTPYIGKMDNTGVEYLVMGSEAGSLYRFDGITTSASTYNMIDTQYSFISAGLRSAPAFADLDGDGKYELAIGNQLGGVMFFKQLFNADTKDVAGDVMNVIVYPNPANDFLNITWQWLEPNTQVDIYIMSVMGQKVLSTSVSINNGNATQVELNNLPSGNYYCVVQANGRRAVKPITIVK